MSPRTRLLVLALIPLALLWLFFAAVERSLAVIERFLALPPPMQWLFGGVLALLAAASLFFVAWLCWPRRRRRIRLAGDRSDIERRLQQLRDRDVDTSALHAELAELDRRQASGRFYVALFGEISTGKSTLLRAFAPDAMTMSDVRGGTTRAVAHVDAHLSPFGLLTLADVPGSRESGGEHHEAIARAEALRAHAVIYLCAGDLTHTQVEEVRWLASFGKPVLVALNKADQWTTNEREQLLARLRQQTGDDVLAVVAISAGGQEHLSRTLADGRREQVVRERHRDIAPLLEALARALAVGHPNLEAARMQAVVATLHERTGTLETASRRSEAEAIVRRYARRAVIGAMAAVAPGSDLLIQGALAAALTRELAGVYGIGVTDVQVNDFVKQARMNLRTTGSLVLAIAGNTLKAFPGLGTLGGGVLHAFAYALIFDSMGHALAASLAERQMLDQADAGARLKTLLADTNRNRLADLAELTKDALRERKKLDNDGTKPGNEGE